MIKRMRPIRPDEESDFPFTEGAATRRRVRELQLKAEDYVRKLFQESSRRRLEEIAGGAPVGRVLPMVRLDLENYVPAVINSQVQPRKKLLSDRLRDDGQKIGRSRQLERQVMRFRFSANRSVLRGK